MRASVGALGIALAAGMLLVAGCGQTYSVAGDESQDPVATTILITDRTDLIFGETGVWEGVQVTVSTPTDDPEADAPLDNERIVYCTVGMVNRSNQSLEYDGLEFMLFDSEGQLYEDFGKSSIPALGVGILEPGDTVTGAVAYNLPTQATVSSVAWQRGFLADPQLTWSVQ